MGKVKDGSTVSKAPKPSKGGSGSAARRRLVQFFANLVSTQTYIPKQGRYARGYTAALLGLVVAIGLYRLFDALIESNSAARYGIVGGLGAALAWIIYRVVQYPPFVDFLVATEAEMNKVSWTSRDDLYRATTVVLVTVTLMAVYLFGVDWVWSMLLQYLRVLRFGGGGAFGSNAG